MFVLLQPVAPLVPSGHLFAIMILLSHIGGTNHGPSAHVVQYGLSCEMPMMHGVIWCFPKSAKSRKEICWLTIIRGSSLVRRRTPIFARTLPLYDPFS
ncbi:hypothetical protein F4782DRAFT_486043 [Xylaria castorea]|nr:hypothetical protein F4782DRAFT_486043 [Xylaria castorea]